LFLEGAPTRIRVFSGAVGVMTGLPVISIPVSPESFAAPSVWCTTVRRGQVKKYEVVRPGIVESVVGAVWEWCVKELNGSSGCGGS